MGKKIAISDYRNFGLLVGGVLIAYWVFKYLFRYENFWIVGGIGALLIITGIATPKWLKEPYKGWMFLGETIGYVVNRIMLSILFFVVLTPFGFIKRIFFQKDPLKLSWQSQGDSYYEQRELQPPDKMERMY